MQPNNACKSARLSRSSAWWKTSIRALIYSCNAGKRFEGRQKTRETYDFTTHLVLNILAHTLLHDGRSCESLDSGVYLPNDAHLRLR